MNKDLVLAALLTAQSSYATSAETAPKYQIQIEAEAFLQTGGDYDGFAVYQTANDETAINYVQTGDWGRYQFSVSQSGFYSLNALVATAVNGAAITIEIDGKTTKTISLNNNGDWDTFNETTLLAPIALYAGEHTLKITGAGNHGWEWNIDRLVFNYDDNESLYDIDNDNHGFFDFCPMTPAGAETDYSGCTSGSIEAYEFAIEAENFDLTGGDFDGVQIYSPQPEVQAINYVQTGDWMSYTFATDFDQIMDISVDAATAIDGAKMEIKVDDHLSQAVTINNNGSWDYYENTELVSSVALKRGFHTLYVRGAGTHGWEWNVDKFIFNENRSSDIDNDGVVNWEDDCENTAESATVNDKGCATNQVGGDCPEQNTEQSSALQNTLIYNEQPGLSYVEQSQSEFQATLCTLKTQGYQLIDISGYDVNGEARYASVWQYNPNAKWEVSIHLHENKIWAKNQELATFSGYHLSKIEAYQIDRRVRFAAIWQKQPELDSRLVYGFNRQHFADRFVIPDSPEPTLVDINGFNDHGTPKLTAAFTNNTEVTPFYSIDLSKQHYLTQINALDYLNYSPVTISAYPYNGEILYAGIWHESNGLVSEAKVGLTLAEHQESVLNQKDKGFELTDISVTTLNGKTFFSSIWTLP